MEESSGTRPSPPRRRMEVGWSVLSPGASLGSRPRWNQGCLDFQHLIHSSTRPVVRLQTPLPSPAPSISVATLMGFLPGFVKTRDYS